MDKVVKISAVTTLAICVVIGFVLAFPGAQERSCYEAGGEFINEVCYCD